MRRTAAPALVTAPLALALAWAPTAGIAAGTRPTPRRSVPLHGPVDVNELLRLARVQQALNARVYYQYSFRQTSRIEELDAEGATKREETRVYRVIPSRQGTVRQLLEQDGEPPSPRALRKQQARNERVRKRWAQIRRKQEKAAAKRRAEATREAEAAGVVRTASVPPANRPAPPAATAPGPTRPLPGAPTSPPRAPGPRAAEPVEPEPGGPAASSVPPPPSAAQPAAAPALPPLPPCDLAQPDRSVRPPWPGSLVHSSARARASAAEARRSRKTAGDYTIFELLSLTSYEYAGACEWDGRPLHVVRFAPPEDFDPLNPVERVVTAMRGTILLDADEIQVLRTEGETVEPIKWGAGMVALRRAHVVFEARKVNDEVWLPAMDLFEFDSRVVFDRDRQRVTHYYDDHHPLSITSSEEFLGVAEDDLTPDAEVDTKLRNPSTP